LKKLIFTITILLQINNFAYAKEVVGIVGAVVGTITNQKNEVLKAGDKIYFGDTITSSDQSKTQLMMADETIISVGSKTEMIIDEFTYDPSTQNGKFLATIQQGSVKLLTGKISDKDPKKLEVKTPAGTLGTRGTEFQAIVDPGTTESKVLLIGPGPNNELGLRPGAVEVSNDQGTVLLDQPLAFTQFSQNTAPTPPVTISPQELDNFNKVLEAKKALDETNDVQEIIVEGNLFDSEGSEAIADVIEAGLQAASGGITAGQVSALLGVTNEQLFGEDFAAEMENESPENQAIIMNAEFGDGLAMLARFGGTDLGATTYADLNAITSGTYTYQANDVNMASVIGTGSGSFNGTAVIDFSARTIQNTYSGNVTLNGDSRTFSYTNTNSYDGLSGQVESLSRFQITSSNTTNVASLDPEAQASNAAISAGSASDGVAHDPNDYVVSGTNHFHADGAVAPFNIQFNGVNQSPTAGVATIALTVTNNSDSSTVANSVNGQRMGITPKREP